MNESHLDIGIHTVHLDSYSFSLAFLPFSIMPRVVPSQVDPFFQIREQRAPLSSSFKHLRTEFILVLEAVGVTSDSDCLTGHTKFQDPCLFRLLWQNILE